jgi:hypothetical protein
MQEVWRFVKMSLEYVNRRGKQYHLYARKTKKGNLSYYMAMKSDDMLVDSIPDGYEIYEDSNARVYVRKIRPRIFTDEEISLVENGVRRYSALSDFRIELKDNSIIVFEPDQDDDWITGISKLLAPFQIERAVRAIKKNMSYSQVMRFVLVDRKSRTFDVERWWFSEDEWMYLDSADDLAKLVRKYCRHLGRESLYELPYM